MNWNKSPLAFEDCRDAFERALNSERGIKISYDTRSTAIKERSRFNYFRKLHRAESKETYPEDHALYGLSIYDTLILRIPKKGTAGDNELFIEHRKVENMKIEEL